MLSRIGLFLAIFEKRTIVWADYRFISDKGLLEMEWFVYEKTRIVGIGNEECDLNSLSVYIWTHWFIPFDSSVMEHVGSQSEIIWKGQLNFRKKIFSTLNSTEIKSLKSNFRQLKGIFFLNNK